jgi:hypothetical protein
MRSLHIAIRSRCAFRDGSLSGKPPLRLVACEHSAKPGAGQAHHEPNQYSYGNDLFAETVEVHSSASIAFLLTHLDFRFWTEGRRCRYVRFALRRSHSTSTTFLNLLTVYPPQSQ